MNPMRHTVVVHGRQAMRELRFEAARERRHGRQIMTFDQLAARLAGGLSCPIDDDTLRLTIQRVLPRLMLGDLDGIKTLPGMVNAAAETLYKAWRAGLDLQARADEHPRLAAVAKLEEAVLAALPPAMMRSVDLVAAALRRLSHAGALFGPIDIIGITELSPCWRLLLHAVAARTPVRWCAGPRAVPDWLDNGIVEVVRTSAHKPDIIAVSAATTYHEAIEAMRWARELMTSGRAEPAEIAIATVNPEDYDDHFLALRSDADFNLYFAHGIKVTASREGQTAAALAEILLRGLSQTRMRRLASLLGASPGPFKTLPAGWMRILPADAPLVSVEAWSHLIGHLTADHWPDGKDHGSTLHKIAMLLSEGCRAAKATGEMLLSGKARAVWRRALLAGPAASLDLTLDQLRQDDAMEGCASAAFMPASALAASPRRFVRLLGLNSSCWPHGMFEDRLLSGIVPAAELDPLPIGAADRRDFATILATTECQVVLSRARRHSDGSLLGCSPLLQGHPGEIYLPRNRAPGHAFSETDRLTARPQEFRALPQAAAAAACWNDWMRPDITPHDGLVRADHPVIQAILKQPQSARSLRQLLRNPLGYVWRYGLHWRARESRDDSLVLEPLAMGDLVHQTLERALRALEEEGGFVDATMERIPAAVNTAAAAVAESWEAERTVPPRVVWQSTLDEARDLSIRALAHRDDLPDARSYGEVPFGGAGLDSGPRLGATLPWDATAAVEIPGTSFRIEGYIDRLDISGNGHDALVRDYKTGKKPKDGIVLNGGNELQRCLYAFAVKAMLGHDVTIGASLFYLRDDADLRLDDPDTTLGDLARYLNAARANLLAGGAVPGIDAGGDHDDFTFAPPANADAVYCKHKLPAVTALLGAAADVWGAP
jgi:hypothetical protein